MMWAGMAETWLIGSYFFNNTTLHAELLRVLPQSGYCLEHNGSHVVTFTTWQIK